MRQVDNTQKQIIDHNVIRNKWAILSFVSFLACVLVSLLFWVDGVDKRIVLFFVSLFAVLTFFFAMKITDTRKTEQLVVVENPLELDCSKIEEGLEDGFAIYGIDGEKLSSNTLESFITSEEVNRKFITEPVNSTMPDELYTFEDTDVLPYTAYLKDNRDKELSKFAALRPDKAVMGLDSPINMSTFDNLDVPVKVIPISRQAVQVTDDAFNKIVVNKKKVSNKIVYSGRKCCLDEQGHLKDFSEATNANQIDICSLMISNDGYILFRRGTQSHPLCSGKVIGSAACSLLPEETDTSRPIQECMIESIHNKIHVIYDIGSDVKIASSFCGFARILKRGGAPEFFCLTRIDLPKSKITAAHHDETSEFIDEMMKEMVPDLESVEDAASYIAQAIKSLKEDVGDSISIDGAAMLHVISQAMGDKTMATKVLQRIELIPR